MLQKEFFQVQPFNPNPYWDPVVVNLSGAQKFEENTIFVPGRYRVLARAAASVAPGCEALSGEIQKDIVIENRFVIRAYCGSKAGINPYSGPFKVNPVLNQSVDVNHIFGTCGSSNKGIPGEAESINWLGSGNCLGNGWSRVSYNSTFSVGAGSCVHIMPVGGVFGTDYYYAFHTTAAPAGNVLGANGGAGSAYGGSASGGSSSYGSMGSIGQISIRGGNTPYGNGGAGAYSGTGLLASSAGNSGTGIGCGKKPLIRDTTPLVTFLGSTAFFNGTNWEDPGTTGAQGAEGAIVITFLGNL